MPSNGKVILIDGNSLLYRAFFAMPHFSTLENVPTNAVYGFTMMLLKIIQEEKPACVLVAFDAPVKTFRHHAYAEYKGTRKRPPDELISQAPLAREMVKAFNIPMLEVDGYEADDVIGTLAKKAESEGYDVVIVTGDLDALQLINGKTIRVMRTIKGVTETFLYDEENVEIEYGLKPTQFPDYKALVGDTSDNIPGVPGIGAKTATKLLQKYGNIENLIYSVEDVEPVRFREMILRGADQAVKSKWLATIVTDMDLGLNIRDCHFAGPNLPRLREMFNELRFGSLLKRLPAEAPAQRDMFSAFEEEPILPELPAGEPVPIGIISTRTDLEPVLDEISNSGGIAIRINGTTERGITADPLGLAVATKAGNVYYVSLSDESGIQLEDFRAVFENDSIPKYGHNLKFEYELTSRLGIPMKGPAFDTLIAAYLLNPSRGTHSLDGIAFDYMQLRCPTRDPKTGAVTGPRGESTVEALFGCEVDAVRQLVSVLGTRLAEDDLGDLMANVEMPLVPILAEMELAGVGVDTEWLNRLSEVLAERIETLEQEIYALAGTDFNIGSTKQLQTILFDKLGLPHAKKTKTGYSTDADTLAALAPAHEIVAKLLEYRELTKLKSTYADSLPKLIDPRTGRIHTSLNQAVTTTGRLSSSEPNLQNIPIKTEIGREIRKAFVASQGNLLISADYSQIELRILAHVSHDPELVRAYQEDADIHTKTATKLFDVTVDEVSKDMRRQAKTVNFAVIYGMSEYGLSRELGIPPGVARKYIADYFGEYPGVKLYEAETLARAQVRGYVESLLGRRRYMPELRSPQRSQREFAERAAVNMPIQGTAADIVKIAMIRVHDDLASRGFKTRLVLQVHDELVFDAPESEVNDVLPLIREGMENAYKLDVPLRVEVKVGPDWCTALPVSAIEEDLGPETL
jgi:DNA polymerase I